MQCTKYSLITAEIMQMVRILWGLPIFGSFFFSVWPHLAHLWVCWGFFSRVTQVLVCCCCCCYVASVVSVSVRPQGRQPTRLPHPWDSPGKNTGMGCHFLLQGMKVKNESEVAQLCPILRNPMDCSLPGFSVHGNFQARILEWVTS